MAFIGHHSNKSNINSRSDILSFYIAFFAFTDYDHDVSR
jgi:hypothetical protein